jgi:hypothetical protein
MVIYLMMYGTKCLWVLIMCRFVTVVAVNSNFILPEWKMDKDGSSGQGFADQVQPRAKKQNRTLRQHHNMSCYRSTNHLPSRRVCQTSLTRPGTVIHWSRCIRSQRVQNLKTMR